VTDGKSAELQKEGLTVSLGRKLAGGLKDLRDSDAIRSGGTIEAHESACRARARVREFDRLAVLLDELEVWTTLPKLPHKETVQILEKQAGSIEKKIGYLVEGLRTIEFDPQGGVLQMRSVKPLADGPERQYFELILTGGWKAVLRRYRGSEVGSGRQNVSMHVTMDLLERLVDDLSAVLTDSRV
jgi:hypothetical protein